MQKFIVSDMFVLVPYRTSQILIRLHVMVKKVYKFVNVLCYTLNLLGK